MRCLTFPSVSHKFNSFGATTILQKKNSLQKNPAKQSWSRHLYPTYSKYSAIFFPPILFSHPFYPAQYIFPTHIQLLMPKLSMNLSLNRYKNELKFYPGQYQHLILWSHLWCATVHVCPQLMYAAICILAIYTFTLNIFLYLDVTDIFAMCTIVRKMKIKTFKTIFVFLPDPGLIKIPTASSHLPFNSFPNQMASHWSLLFLLLLPLFSIHPGCALAIRGKEEDHGAFVSKALENLEQEYRCQTPTYIVIG